MKYLNKEKIVKIQINDKKESSNLNYIKPCRIFGIEWYKEYFTWGFAVYETLEQVYKDNPTVLFNNEEKQFYIKPNIEIFLTNGYEKKYFDSMDLLNEYIEKNKELLSGFLKF